MDSLKLVEKILFYCMTQIHDCRNGLRSNKLIKDVKTFPELVNLVVKEFDKYLLARDGAK